MNRPDALRLTTRVVRPADSVFAESGGEVVMMSLETSSYYALDAIGSRVWELLAEPTTVADLCTRLQSEYDVDGDTCRHDVSKLLRELLDARLVHTLDA